MINAPRPYLLPLSFLYGIAVRFRNYLFDTGRKPSHPTQVPSIGIGNLSVGGTGKTQVADYLISRLCKKYKVALVSRGYGRQTKGLLLESQAMISAANFGDEPVMLKKKFPEITLAVSEKRLKAVTHPTIAQNCDLIVLDDNFQHRHVTPHLQILLTTWENPWFTDALLPAGNLREPSTGKHRADVVLVTKCPKNLPIKALRSFTKKLKLGRTQRLFFTYQRYGSILPLSGDVAAAGSPVLLVTGIAHPAPLREFLKEKYADMAHLVFPDHHRFSPADYEKMRKTARDIGATHLITTEKDITRIDPTRIPGLSIAIQPVEIGFLNDRDEGRFWNLVSDKVGIKPTHQG